MIREGKTPDDYHHRLISSILQVVLEEHQSMTVAINLLARTIHPIVFLSQFFVVIVLQYAFSSSCWCMCLITLDMMITTDLGFN